MSAVAKIDRPVLRLVGAEETTGKRPAHKKRGTKSEVFPYELDELKAMLNYFAENGKWTHYLVLVFGCNMARRCGDTLNLTWGHVFDNNGNFRADLKEIIEDKTDKLACPHINQAVRDAVSLYLDKTGIDPSENNYENFIFVQTGGNYAGRKLTEDGHLKALKAAAKAVGITKNIGTHSARKTFGQMNRRLHPNDGDSMELLRTIFNHSDVATTSRYIGLTKEKTDRYYDDFGKFFLDYICGDKECCFQQETPVTSLDTNDLRELLIAAYQAGLNNAGSTDPMAAMRVLSELMKVAEEKDVNR